MADATENSSDDELNIYSENFNPLKALYSDKFKIPVPDVKRLDNVNMFFSRLKSAGNALDGDLEKVTRVFKYPRSNEKTGELDEKKYHVTAAGRTFLKEQAPVHRGPKMKYKRDLIMRMDTANGPIALLNKFKVNRTRVKIHIRKEHGVKGYLTGLIEAFDKHFNIVLVDCIEVWKRRKFTYSDNNVALLGKPQDCSQLLKSMGINVPEITAKSLDRKTVQCTRKIAQMMVRGEDVVLVGEDKDEVNDRLDLMKV